MSFTVRLYYVVSAYTANQALEYIHMKFGLVTIVVFIMDIIVLSVFKKLIMI